MDPLRERTARLLTDYLRCCAREPGAREPPPPTREAALLREAAARTRRQHPRFFASCRGYRGSRVAAAARMADAVFCDGRDLSWGRVVMLVAFAGALLERDPRNTPQGEKLDNLAWDCERLADLLCARLLGRHRAWLEARGGWDGFCHFFNRPLPLSFWRRLLFQTLLSGLLAITIVYFCKVLKF